MTRYERAAALKAAGEKQSVIASELGVTEERVRQILNAGPPNKRRSGQAIVNAIKLLTWHGFTVTRP